jgi:hypothetical protein
LFDQAEEHGNATVEVAEDEHGAGYVFTVGAWRRFGVPEAVVVGLPDGMGSVLVNAYVRRASAGERFALGRPYLDFFAGTPVVLERVAKGHYLEFFGSALLLYPNGDFPAVQLIVATPEGAWPWQPGRLRRLAARAHRERQPGKLDARNERALIPPSGGTSDATISPYPPIRPIALLQFAHTPRRTYGSAWSVVNGRNGAASTRVRLLRNMVSGLNRFGVTVVMPSVASR